MIWFIIICFCFSRFSLSLSPWNLLNSSILELLKIFFQNSLASFFYTSSKFMESLLKSMNLYVELILVHFV